MEMLLDRRDFVKCATMVGVGLAAGLAPATPARAGAPSRAARVVDPSPALAVRQAVETLGGMARYVKPGQTVVVKPNIGWDRRPDQAANTNPEVVAEVVALCLTAGAAKVKLFDRTCNDPRRCYVTSGIAPMVEGLNDPRVEITQIDERKFRQVQIPGGTLLKNASFYEEALDADAFINVPVAKHHSAAGLTLGMKNIMGVLGSNRAVFHRNLHEALVDMNRAVRSTLTIIDATRILVANGPQGGRLEDVRKLDTIVASEDVVAADAVAAALFGKNLNDLAFLRLAQAAGLGIADTSRIELLKVGG